MYACMNVCIKYTVYKICDSQHPKAVDLTQQLHATLDKQVRLSLCMQLLVSWCSQQWRSRGYITRGVWEGKLEHGYLLYEGVDKPGYLKNAEGARDPFASFTVWLSKLNSSVFIQHVWLNGQTIAVVIIHTMAVSHDSLQKGFCYVDL